ncbi:hypothetical protein CLI64_02700 [Nostoc sp. CENA543]|uniref:hypothetical protein n=1 Tax=Nostoc sp. CENA543 TaxID=1869241 RepID=UPI000CA2D2B7|nr:hypothetical protein [Nostoc sp. CENA543]AUS99388.1 hypothetical protein CLI64_02700 [Nostoc sp. CENA543]
MGRWTPLVLMAGGLAILMGTLLGINFPMREAQKVSNNAPGDKASKVLPANINVNSSAPSRNRGNATTPENRSNVAQQEDFNTGDNSSDSASEERGNVSQEDRRSTSRTNVAQSNANESPSSSDNNDSSNNNTSDNTTENTSDTTTEVQSTTSSPSNQDREPIRALW